MTPIFGRKKEPKEVFDENWKKADELWESPELWKSSEYKKLLKHIEKAQEIAETIEVDQKDMARLWSMKGSVFNMGYHRLDKALECYDEALSLNPRDFGSSLNRLQVLKSMGKWDEIIEDSDKVLKLIAEVRGMKITSMTSPAPVPETWDQVESAINQICAGAFVIKGMSLSRKPEEAMKCFDRALKMNPNDCHAWSRKAFALQRLGKFREAIECYDKALKANPRDPWFPKRYVAWGGKAYALYKLGKFREAIPCYDKALDIAPKFVWAWYHKGVALNSIGRHGEAKECFRKATEIDPNLVKKIKSLPV